MEYIAGSDDVQELIEKSKFSTMPLFFKSYSGHIGLQGDHGEVWYRNIRVRKIIGFNLEKKKFFKTVTLMASGFALPTIFSCENKKMDFKISLVEWSLHRMLYSGKSTILIFANLLKSNLILML